MLRFTPSEAYPVILQMHKIQTELLHKIQIETLSTLTMKESVQCSISLSLLLQHSSTIKCWKQYQPTSYLYASFGKEQSAWRSSFVVTVVLFSKVTIKVKLLSWFLTKNGLSCLKELEALWRGHLVIERYVDHMYVQIYVYIYRREISYISLSLRLLLHLYLYVIVYLPFYL